MFQVTLGNTKVDVHPQTAVVTALATTAFLALIAGMNHLTKADERAEKIASQEAQIIEQRAELGRLQSASTQMASSIIAQQDTINSNTQEISELEALLAEARLKQQEIQQTISSAQAQAEKEEAAVSILSATKNQLDGNVAALEALIADQEAALEELSKHDQRLSLIAPSVLNGNFHITDDYIPQWSGKRIYDTVLGTITYESRQGYNSISLTSLGEEAAASLKACAEENLCLNGTRAVVGKSELYRYTDWDARIIIMYSVPNKGTEAGIGLKAGGMVLHPFNSLPAEQAAKLHEEANKLRAALNG